jgi:hypothetical protein
MNTNIYLSTQIHVEVERARLTMALTKIKEADGDIPGAAEILHELQVSNLTSQYSHQTFYFLVSSSFARDFFSPFFLLAHASFALFHSFFR